MCGGGNPGRGCTYSESNMLEDPTETRRCLSCGSVSAEFGDVTDYTLDVRVAGMPAGDVDHGSKRRYECRQCGESFSLLDSYRRMWMYYGLAVGVAALLFGGWLSTPSIPFEGVAMLLVGAVAVVFTVATLVSDSRTRRRSAPPPASGEADTSPASFTASSHG